jgi:hypothetical protein
MSIGARLPSLKRLSETLVGDDMDDWELTLVAELKKVDDVEFARERRSSPNGSSTSSPPKACLDFHLADMVEM